MNNDPLPNDNLDPLLRAWHDQNAARAAELRDATLARAAAEGGAPLKLAGATHPTRGTRTFGGRSFWFGRGLAAAALVALAIAGAFLLPIFPNDAVAGGIVMVPDGGRLVAIDRGGQLLGPCPLAHTDVHADIAGPFTRVTLAQKFQNPYRVPIEAVYTFPLGERSAVDRMRMIVNGPSGERIVNGEVKERDLARFIYEAAREQGYVASLLEQERPNIFTQSVANIEPGSTVTVEISYVETLAMKDGIYEFAFPMVVGPRYIPGQPSQSPPVPAGWTARTGVVLLGPAALSFPDQPPVASASQADPMAVRLAQFNPWGSAVTPARLQAMMEDAIAVQPPSSEQLAALSAPLHTFTATYVDNSQEPGALYATGCGTVGGRWFVVPSSSAPKGSGFSADTTQVPDASRITPMPTRPGVRAGHDISLSVSLDTGGPGVREMVSQLHGVDVKWNGANRCTLSLRGGSTIPNKDFVLNWGLEGKSVLEGVFSYARGGQDAAAGTAGDAAAQGAAKEAGGAAADGFVTLVMTPPPPAANAPALPRELVFVMDTSGSMNGFPIEKSKEVMRRALATMRPEDTFNVVTFAGSTAVLWPELRHATPDNVKAAFDFVNGRQAGGGTEMMKAIEAALVQMPMDPVNVAPDGTVSVPPRTPISPSAPNAGVGDAIDRDGIDRHGAAAPRPMRVAVFLTDGFVGNDQGIIAAVAANAGSTRVFTFGIGNSVNRYLLEEMARQGRGACDVVLLSDAADAAVDLFTRRIQTPVLRDITVAFEGVEVTDLQPSGKLLPDLFDLQPLVVHGRWARTGGGTVVVRGQTASGPYERRIPVALSGLAASSASMLPQLWARTKVDAILAPNLQAVEQQTLAADVRRSVVQLGEQFQIMTPYTSFVAVEKSRVIVGGKPMLVNVPIEFPEGLRWEGFFGDTWCNDAVIAAARAAEGLGALKDAEVGTRGEAGEAIVLSDLLKAGEADQAGGKGVDPASAAKGGKERSDEERKSLAEGEKSFFGKPKGEVSAPRERVAAARDIARVAPMPGAPTSGGTTMYRVAPNAGPSVAFDTTRGTSPGGSSALYLGQTVTLRSATEFAGGGGGVLGGAASPALPSAQPAPAAAPQAPPAPATAAHAPSVPPVPPAPSEAASPLPAAKADGLSDGAREVIRPAGAEVNEGVRDAGNLYMVQAGDTLSGIAAKVLGDSGKWRQVLDANAPLLQGDEKGLKPGMQLVIPNDASKASAVVATDGAHDAASNDAIMAIPLGARDTLVRVLERRLLALALYARLPIERRKEVSALPSDIAELCVPPAAATEPFGKSIVQLTILVAKDAANAREQLVDAGFRTQGQGAGPNGHVILVGECAVQSLVTIGLVPGVVRIEPRDLGAATHAE